MKSPRSPSSTVGVAQLHHYAQDAGKSQAEIEKITEPEVSLVYDARSVIVHVMLRTCGNESGFWYFHGRCEPGCLGALFQALIETQEGIAEIGARKV